MIIYIYSECKYLLLSMHCWLFFSFFFFKYLALKHLDTLIKSPPQAAAPIHSHNEKYGFSYITREMRRCFELQQFIFQFCSFLTPTKTAARAQMMDEEKRKRLIAESVACVGVACTHVTPVLHVLKDV